MKKKSLNQKLLLNKTTITNLNLNQLKMVYGGEADPKTITKDTTDDPNDPITTAITTTNNGCGTHKECASVQPYCATDYICNG